jgi:hypothetical protein
MKRFPGFNAPIQDCDGARTGNAVTPALKLPKVFGIGFHKTGTTSLAHALRLLGYNVTGPNAVRDADISTRALPIALELGQAYDGFQDNPWPLLYREMDAAFPGSKFVLTTRAPEDWIRSCVSHFGRGSTPMRQWIYGAGSPLGNEERYVARFRQHERDVRAYFADRPDSLLILGITSGEGWEKLCPFLGCAVPDQPFPHRNTASERRDKS